MICNGKALLHYAPIKDMATGKVHQHGVSYGLSEAGYDIRIAQTIEFFPAARGGPRIRLTNANGETKAFGGKFVLASAIEEFNMPDTLVGVVHDKSTWARQGLSVFNTVIEPGWKGFLTLELVFHGSSQLCIPAGAGIAQVVFHSTSVRSSYSGKYQNQGAEPAPSIFVG